jgi:hypothetical protein
VLHTGQKEMGKPIEIEFAVELNKPPDVPRMFYVLQIRPIVSNSDALDIEIDEVKPEKTIILADHALGNGIIEGITNLVYVKPESFDPSRTKDIAAMIGELNQSFLDQRANYILVGPGRWGSSDPWLGIPVKWPQISAARIIVESGLENYRIDPSQGTHFFQNLTSFGVGYFTLNPFIKDGHYDLDFLNSQDTVFENEYIRHIKFDSELTILIDGRNSKGIVMKPGESLPVSKKAVR